ncbi:hypothetical protein BDQ17DRAFT_1364505 [Cyathus striatus]|nr:hypothetical protein BDQ17DRAFT_1364505 [Cyathus striatus]
MGTNLILLDFLQQLREDILVRLQLFPNGQTCNYHGRFARCNQCIATKLETCRFEISGPLKLSTQVLSSWPSDMPRPCGTKLCQRNATSTIVAAASDLSSLKFVHKVIGMFAEIKTLNVVSESLDLDYCYGIWELFPDLEELKLDPIHKEHRLLDDVSSYFNIKARYLYSISISSAYLGATSCLAFIN